MRATQSSTNIKITSRHLKRHRSSRPTCISRCRPIHCLATITAMFAQKGSGFNHFRRALVVSSAARRESARLTFSPAHHRRHQSHAVMSSNTCNAFFSRPRHRHCESEQSPFKRIRPRSRYITSSVLAGKSENTGEASVPATRSPSVQKFLDSICQSFGADILPEVLKGVTESDGPSMESPLVVLLAVSGGCDSVALLHAMKQLACEIPDSTKGEKEFFGLPSQRKMKALQRTERLARFM